MTSHNVTGHISGKGRLARTLLAACLGATALVSTSALAQEAPSANAPSANATVNLIRALVGKGVLSQAEADAMIAQADAEAAQARATAAAAQGAVAAVSPASAQPGTSVRYVPQFVRDEIKQELRQEVLADAKTQGLVAPDALPDWVRKVKLTGDMRMREEGRYFSNANALDFVNIAAINAGSPYNTDPTSNPYNPPILNSRKDRNIARLRARLGLEAQIDEDLTAYFRIATGSDSSPVSTNQTMGGFYAKKDLWLDRAYIDFKPIEGSHLMVGRMANPFKMTELVWDDDINLDGAAASYGREIATGFTAYVTGGVFPLDYVPDDFPKTGTANVKASSTNNDKWLFAGQVGGQWKPSAAMSASLNLAYYDYAYVAGDLSPSCSNLADYCLTDFTRPGFSQKGNTLFALRDITTNNPANQASPQYYGLASKFEVLALSGDVDWMFAGDLRLNLAAHISKNLGYDEADVQARGFNANSGLSQIANNNETCSVALVAGACPAGKNIFDSGDIAWLVSAAFGSPRVEKRGDWNVAASYRYIEPDALLDAFTDSDFRLGGTNAKGWTVGASYGVRKNTALSLRWMNAEEVSGPPFRANLLQADLSVKF